MNLIYTIGLSAVLALSCSKQDFELKTDTDTSTSTSSSTATSSNSKAATNQSTVSSIKALLTHLDPVVVSGSVVTLQLQNLGSLKPEELSVSLFIGTKPATVKVTGTDVQVSLPTIDSDYVQVKTLIKMASSQALSLIANNEDAYYVFVTPVSNPSLISSVPWHVCQGVNYYDPVSKTTKIGTDDLNQCLATKKCPSTHFSVWVSTEWVCTLFGDLVDSTKAKVLQDYLLEELVIPDPYSQTTVTASVDSLLADGLTGSTLTVTLLDENSVPVVNKTIAFNIEFGSLSAISNSGLSDDSGVVTASISSSQAGINHILVSVDGQTVGSINITFLAGVPVTAAIAIANNSVPGDGTLTTIPITLKDANNNPVSGVNVGATASFGNISPSSLVTDANGVASFNISSTSLGNTTLIFNVPGINNPSPNCLLTYILGPVSPADSIVHTLASSGPGDGTSLISVEVTLKDAASHLLSGIPVTLSSSLSSATVLTPIVSSDINGLASFSVKSSASGLNTVTATIDGPLTIGADQMTFTAYFSSDVILSSSPVAFWQFNENSGDLAADSAENHLYPGSYVNSPTFDADGVYLNGFNQYISIPSAVFTDNFSSDQDFTIEGWYKSAALPSVDARIFDFANPVDGKYFFFSLNDSIFNEMYYVFYNGISQNALGASVSAFSVSSGEQWTYIALVMDSVGGSIYMYQDGQTGYHADINALLPNSTINSLGTLSTNTIGAGSNSQFLNGHFRNFAIYNRALSGSEINQHKSAPLQ